MNQVIVSVVQDLIVISEARRSGYESAVSKINDPELKEKFKECIEQSNVFVYGMTPFIQDIDQIEIIPELVEPVCKEWEKVGSIIKSTPSVLVASCLNAEKVTAKAFESSLKEALPITIQEIVSQELAQIEGAMICLKQLNSDR